MKNFIWVCPVAVASPSAADLPKASSHGSIEVSPIPPGRGQNTLDGCVGQWFSDGERERLR